MTLDTFIDVKKCSIITDSPRLGKTSKHSLRDDGRGTQRLGDWAEITRRAVPVYTKGLLETFLK